MNDQTGLTRKLDEGALPSEAEIYQRVTEIEARRKQRTAIDRLVKDGKFDEAMKTVGQAGISLLDTPIFLEEFKSYTEKQQALFDRQIEQFREILDQAKESWTQTKTVIEHQELLAAFFRADATLDDLDIVKLETAIGELERLESSSLAKFRQAFQKSIMEKIHEAQPPSIWVDKAQRIAGILHDEDRVFTAHDFRQLVDEIDSQAVSGIGTVSFTISTEKPAWVAKLQQQMEVELGRAIQGIPLWFYSRLDQLRYDLNWLKDERGRPEFAEAQSDPRKWLAFVANRPVETSRLAVLRRQKMSMADGEIDSQYRQTILDVEACLHSGQVVEAARQLDSLEGKLKDSERSLTAVEMLSFQNRVMLLRHYLSLYQETQTSLVQANQAYVEAKSFRGRNRVSRALLANRLLQASLRLRRDLQALPPFVKTCLMSGQSVDTLLEQTINKLDNFNWGNNND